MPSTIWVLRFRTSSWSATADFAERYATRSLYRGGERIRINGDSCGAEVEPGAIAVRYFTPLACYSIIERSPQARQKACVPAVAIAPVLTLSDDERVGLGRENLSVLPHVSPPEVMRPAAHQQLLSSDFNDVYKALIPFDFLRSANCLTGTRAQSGATALAGNWLGTLTSARRNESHSECTWTRAGKLTTLTCRSRRNQPARRAFELCRSDSDLILILRPVQLEGVVSRCHRSLGTFKQDRLRPPNFAHR